MSGEHVASPTPESGKGGWLRPVLYLLAVGLVAAVGWRVYTNQKAAAAKQEQAANALLSRPTPVQVVTVDRRPMPIYITALGTVTPYYTVTVKARVNGQLDRVNFTEGQTVAAGQTILVVDPQPYKAALDQAKGTLLHDQALLKDAQAEYRRYTALYQAGVASKEQLDLEESTQGQYEGAIASDKAAIETAQLQLDWCTVQSPITGRIGLRLVDPGNIITANTTNLVIVNQLQPIAVYFTLPENQLPEVLGLMQRGQALVAEAWDRGDTTKIATGKLLTADNQIDTTTGTDKLKAVFTNADNRLFPNQFVNIHLVLENRPDALVLPSVAVQSGTVGNFVWVARHDEAKNTDTVAMTPVKIELAEGQMSILSSGISEGERVVIDGADRLRDGAAVVVSTPRSRSGQAATGANSMPVAPWQGAPQAAPSAGHARQQGKGHEGAR